MSVLKKVEQKVRRIRKTLVPFLGSGGSRIAAPPPWYFKPLPTKIRERDVRRAVRTIRESGLFDAAYYLDRNPAVRDQRLDPVEHYVRHGHRAYLEPSAAFSMQGYAAENPGARASAMGPLYHYATIGLPKKRSVPRNAAEAHWVRPDHERPQPDDNIYFELMEGVSYFSRFNFVFEGETDGTYYQNAVDQLASQRPSFTQGTDATVSIVIPIYGQTPFILNCLDSLSQHHTRFSTEIIVVDDASPEEWRLDLLKAIPWIRYERHPKNSGFIASCNYGASIAKGRYLVFLNSDTRVARDWLDELIGSYDVFPKAGLVGSKLFNADGTLQEAGGIYWRDGSGWNYGRGRDPNHPKFCFARQVDYCSGAAISVPADVWSEMGGFDPAFAPAYYEDGDLAFRIRQSGREVWMQPLARVIHYEGATSGRDVTQGAKAYQVVNHIKFTERWADALANHGLNGKKADAEANRYASRRMLVIDTRTPTPDQDSGSFITEKMMRAMIQLGWRLSFVPLHNYLFDQKYSADLQRMGVECIYFPFFKSLKEVIDSAEDFQYILVYRLAALKDIYDELIGRLPTTRMIFHTVDLHYLRERREAELFKDQRRLFRSELTETTELGLLARVDCGIVHTDVERGLVAAQIPAEHIITFPYICDTVRSDVAFDDRRDVMFLGGFKHPPNVDAVTFFVHDVWPLILPRLPRGSRLLIVGASPTPEIELLANDSIVVTGMVPDVAPYFERAKVFVAPLRYGAGIKGKLIQSLAHGVPSVVTTIAAEGIGLTSEKETIVADTPQEIADGVLRLYASRELWSSMQAEGYRFVETNYSWERCLELCRRILDVADASWLHRHRAKRKRELEALVSGGEWKSGTA